MSESEVVYTSPIFSVCVGVRQPSASWRASSRHQCRCGILPKGTVVLTGWLTEGIAIAIADGRGHMEVVRDAILGAEEGLKNEMVLTWWGMTCP